MSFLQNQVTNFKNQYNRIVSFNKTINSKLSKSGEFSNASSYLLAALGNTSVYYNVHLLNLFQPAFDFSRWRCEQHQLRRYNQRHQQRHHRHGDIHRAQQLQHRGTQESSRKYLLKIKNICFPLCPDQRELHDALHAGA